MTNRVVATADRANRARHLRGRYRSPVNRDLNDAPPRSARIADTVTGVFGSWAFILMQTAPSDRIKAEHDFDVNVLALRALAESCSATSAIGPLSASCKSRSRCC
jgi:uncharacterized membrane protein